VVGAPQPPLHGCAERTTCAMRSLGEGRLEPHLFLGRRPAASRRALPGVRPPQKRSDETKSSAAAEGVPRLRPRGKQASYSEFLLDGLA
jgi:hypothetical protein